MPGDTAVRELPTRYKIQTYCNKHVALTKANKSCVLVFVIVFEVRWPLVFVIWLKLIRDRPQERRKVGGIREFATTVILLAESSANTITT